MQKLNLMIVVGTRPEIIRLSEVIKLCRQHFNTTLVHTGQNYDYELNQVFFDNFDLGEPDYYLDTPGAHLGETVGNIIARSYELMQQLKPDALLVLGDTNSCLAAYSAKRLRIPIFHMEAGNRCFVANVPEETNRRMVDHLASINLAYTQNARLYLLEEGIGKDTVYVTGSPIPEVLKANAEKIEQSKVLSDLNLKPKEYFVISMHREAHIDNAKSFTSLIQALNTTAETYNLPMVFSTHPRTKKRLEETGLALNPLIQSMKPLDFPSYNKLQQNAYCVLSDSGTLAEEASTLKFPAVSLRTSQERPEGLDAGSFLLGGNTPSTILPAIQIATTTTPATPRDYQDTNVAEKVVRIIQSYAAIMKQRLWGLE
jgi:UDP-N-acetylglucosamine 2-epimerase (non-hydrolysing)